MQPTTRQVLINPDYLTDPMTLQFYDPEHNIPMTLPCGHNLGKLSIQNLKKYNMTQCPICRHEFNPTRCPENFFIKDLVRDPAILRSFNQPAPANPMPAAVPDVGGPDIVEDVIALLPQLKQIVSLRKKIVIHLDKYLSAKKVVLGTNTGFTVARVGATVLSGIPKTRMIGVLLNSVFGMGNVMCNTIDTAVEIFKDRELGVLATQHDNITKSEAIMKFLMKYDIKRIETIHRNTIIEAVSFLLIGVDASFEFLQDKTMCRNYCDSKNTDAMAIADQVWIYAGSILQVGLCIARWYYYKYTKKKILSEFKTIEESVKRIEAFFPVEE